MATEKFGVRNRWIGAVQFTAEIVAPADMLPSVKLGLAVRWAHKNDADLSGAYLRGADLSGADLSDAYLRGADLSDADLSGADLSDAYLRGADLSGADLSGAYLRGADLSGADLSDAYLRGADLSDADLSGADLSDACLRSIEADLRFVLSKAHNEVPNLISALRNGKVNGSTYDGPCACFGWNA